MQPNVYIFILDTIDRDQVRSQGSPGHPLNFLEKVLTQGTRFQEFFPAGGTTRVSVNAMFNGFFGGTSGLNHQHCTSLFEDCPAVTLTQVFRHHGYRTLGFTQGDISLNPAGFDELWTRQEPFTSQFPAREMQGCSRPTFAYFHLYAAHDPAFGQPGLMTPENYRQHLDELSAELEVMWNSFVQPGDVAVIASDHGCRLREHLDPSWRFYQEEEPTAGTFLTEATIGGICTLYGASVFSEREVPALVRGIDIFPTLCDALGLERPEVQGRSMWPALQGLAPWPRQPAYVETGGIPLPDGRAAACAVREDGWKFVRYATCGEGLYHVAEDGAERNNLQGTGHPQEDRLRLMLERQQLENARGVAAFYGDSVGLAESMRGSGPAPGLPDVHRGERPFSFAGLIDDEVRRYLVEHTARHTASWMEAGERVVLYSTSEHTVAFLEALPGQARRQVVGIIDGNESLWGSQFLGYPVFGPEDIWDAARPTLVAVGHHHYANDMYIQLKRVCPDPVPVYSIYHLDRPIPLWWDSPRAAFAGDCEES